MSGDICNDGAIQSGSQRSGTADVSDGPRINFPARGAVRSMFSTAGSGAAMQDRTPVEGVGELPFLMLAVGRDGRILHANRALRAVLGDAEDLKQNRDGDRTSRLCATGGHSP